MAIIWIVSSFETPSFPTSLFPMRDKGVHLVEYGVLGFLVAHACLHTFPRHPRARVAVFAILAGLLWGVLDEIHQAFVPGRSADLLDIVADSIGVTLGTLLRLLAHHLRARLRPPSAKQETSSP
jgi:VanZ family protein